MNLMTVMKKTDSPKGNIILKIGDPKSAINPAENSISGVVVDGAGIDAEVTLKIPKNKMSVEDYLKKSNMKVFEGALMQVEGVKMTTPPRNGSAGIGEARYMKSFIRNPEQTGDRPNTPNFGKTMQLSGESKQSKDKNGNPYRSVFVFETDKETSVTSTDHLKESIKSALKDHGGAMVCGVSETNVPYQMHQIKAMSSPETAAESFMGQFPDEALVEINAFLKDNPGKISVVPFDSIMIGTDTRQIIAEKKAEGNDLQAPIREQHFMPNNVSQRFAIEFNKLEKTQQDIVNDAFQAHASEAAKRDLKENGYGGVAPKDMTDFLAAYDISLIQMPPEDRGTVKGAFVSQPYNPEKPQDGSYVTKLFATGYPEPLLPIEVFKDLAQSYRNEMKEAIHVILERPLTLDNNASAKDAGNEDLSKDAGDEAPVKGKGGGGAGGGAAPESAGNEVNPEKQKNIDDLLRTIEDGADYSLDM